MWQALSENYHCKKVQLLRLLDANPLTFERWKSFCPPPGDQSLDCCPTRLIEFYLFIYIYKLPAAHFLKGLATCKDKIKISIKTILNVFDFTFVLYFFQILLNKPYFEVPFELNSTPSDFFYQYIHDIFFIMI